MIDCSIPLPFATRLAKSVVTKAEQLVAPDGVSGVSCSLTLEKCAV